MMNVCHTTLSDNKSLVEEINDLRKKKNAVILAHYYQRGELQDVADYVGDSLALAQWAAKTNADIIVMCGVHFMGETAKILCPDKKVLVPDLEAGCSLADSCPADEFASFVKSHSGYTVISYVNTSAAVKAYTDVVVTSTNARQIVESFPKDEKIIFGPDRNLGNYINSLTGREMILWDGACHVHEQFSISKIIELKKQYPDAEVLAHPECKSVLLKLADKVGSTAALLKYAVKSDKTHARYIGVIGTVKTISIPIRKPYFIIGLFVFYKSLKSDPCSLSHSIDLGSAWRRFFSPFNESWKTMIEPLRVYFFTLLKTLSPFNFLL